MTNHPMPRPPIIAPSMLKCDYANMQQEIERLEAAKIGWLHWDVMDGHFVPNLSYGAMVICSIRGRTKAFFDAHLMISDPGNYLDDYLQAGCDAITIHIEAVPEPTPLLGRIRSAGRLAGLAINPGTPVARLEPFLAECDLVLLMSVKTSERFLSLLDHHGLDGRWLTALCLSEAVAAPLRPRGWGEISVARTPELTSMLELISAAGGANPPSPLPSRERRSIAKVRSRPIGGTACCGSSVYTSIQSAGLYFARKASIALSSVTRSAWRWK